MKLGKEVLPALEKAGLLIVAASATSYAVKDVDEIQRSFMPPALGVPATLMPTGVYVSNLVINALILAGCVYLFTRLD